eukprot:6172756-Pleurochrysis_carterae.AAC.2
MMRLAIEWQLASLTSRCRCLTSQGLAACCLLLWQRGWGQQEGRFEATSIEMHFGGFGGGDAVWRSGRRHGIEAEARGLSGKNPIALLFETRLPCFSMTEQESLLGRWRR